MRTETIRLWEKTPEVILQTYLWHDSDEYQTGKQRPAVIICPGGAYMNTSDREAEPVALRFLAKGMQAFVLRYTTLYGGPVEDLRNPPPANAASRYPQPLVDLAKALLTVRQNAGKYRVDPDRIAICGFSAGGHLAASLGVHWNSGLLRAEFPQEGPLLKPNALILGYPLLDYPETKRQNELSPDPAHLEIYEHFNRALFGNPNPSEEELVQVSPSRYVSADTPPAFLWHTADDSLTTVSNSLLFADQLRKHGIPFELHVFESGVHGLSLGDETTAAEPAHLNPHAAAWADLALAWLKLRFQEGMS